MSRRSRALGTYNSFNPKNKLKAKFYKFLKTLILIFFFYQIISFFIISSFSVGTSAMEPGIVKNQKILSSPLISGRYLKVPNIKIPGLRAPRRGDIVIIEPGNREKPSWYIQIIDPVIRFFTFQQKSLLSGNSKPWNNQIAVKRIIGVPGDSVKLINYRFFIKPAGELTFLSEEQITADKYTISVPLKQISTEGDMPFDGNMEEIQLADDHYFVANDNRQIQYDSRFYGPITSKNISGTVFLSYWPGFSFK